jgi:integrase/recombinase XerC
VADTVANAEPLNHHTNESHTTTADTRHTFGTRLVREGHDLVVVAELLGHARLDQTRRYSLPTQADRQHAINSLLTDN